MRVRFGRAFAGLAAIAAAACFAAAPAEARDLRGRGKSITKAANGKHAKPTRHARAPTYVVWHGWAGSFHLDGVRYRGGNPRGPASALNNWEGGFHPVAFWKLLERNNA